MLHACAVYPSSPADRCAAWLAHACLKVADPSADAQGLVLPPRVAHTQVVIIPIVNAKMSAEEKSAMYQRAEELLQSLRQAGVKVQADTRENYTPGWKYSHWELMVGPPARASTCQARHERCAMPGAA